MAHAEIGIPAELIRDLVSTMLDILTESGTLVTLR